MKKLRVGSAVVWAAVALLAGCGKKEAEKRLTMGTTANCPPFVTRGGPAGSADVVGFDVDVARAIAEKAGLPLKIAEMDFNLLLPALAEGKVDMVLAALSINDERRALVDFSEPYYQDRQIVMAYAGGMVPETKEQLREMRVGYLSGSNIGLAAAEDVVGQGNVQVFATPEEMIAEMANNRLDCAVVDEPRARALLEQDSFLMFSPVAIETSYGVAVRKGNTNLLETVNQAIAAIAADGRRDRFAAEWLNPAPESKE